MILELYLKQEVTWHRAGQIIYAQYDDENVLVYQAYRDEIADYAVKSQAFGGEFSLNRMSWIKPNFFWMMYRCGWGTKAGQERCLAIWLKREAFDLILTQTVHSSYIPAIYKTKSAWKTAVAKSDVRLQWDPDHNPAGGKLERRAIQLGLRGETLRQYAQGGWISRIEDISDFVAEQRPNARKPYSQLLSPKERVYRIEDKELWERLEISL